MDIESKYKLELIRLGLWVCAILYSASVLMGSWIYTGFIQIERSNFISILMLGTAGTSLVIGIWLTFVGYRILKK